MSQSTHSQIADEMLSALDERGVRDADIEEMRVLDPRDFSSGRVSERLPTLSGMSVDRTELHHLVDALPEEQVAAVGAELRRRLSQPTADSTWPPEFFNIIDGVEAPSDVAANVDLYLAAYGFGRDSL